jgi:hypothetical protein
MSKNPLSPSHVLAAHDTFDVTLHFAAGRVDGVWHEALVWTGPQYFTTGATLEEAIQLAKFMWFEGGNWSCDCNRLRMFPELVAKLGDLNIRPCRDQLQIASWSLDMNQQTVYKERFTTTRLSPTVAVHVSTEENHNAFERRMFVTIEEALRFVHWELDAWSPDRSRFEIPQTGQVFDLSNFPDEIYR